MELDFLPQHLRKYVVEQNYEKYTPVDQAVWRYILRQLRAYLSVHGHECYPEGLIKTGICVERIPRISEISEKLQEFGWRALPVSGFIPPAAFMELQSLGILPVASDMRTLDHLTYTPAPDIVHEAAGHAPILIHPEFSEYLRQYAQIAKKALISKEDLDLYEAIRELSDVKENPSSTEAEVRAAEKNLSEVIQKGSHVSEATELSRMNWWTAEYGLIGTPENPRLFGAGLLSSVGEAKWCLTSKVKKIPLSLDCIKMTYDITEPQPQLFVTPDFQTLSVVLEEMAQGMAFRVGGLSGLQKAIEAQSVNTAELNSGLQISGLVEEVLTDSQNRPAYLRISGPTQLSYSDKELHGHDKSYHAHGFGSPVGTLKKFPNICPSQLSPEQWKALGAEIGSRVSLEFTSGVKVTGKVRSTLVREGKTLLLTLEEATANLDDRILFAPEWGVYDMALGQNVVSVFGGPADRVAYGETTDFVAKRVPAAKYSDRELALHHLYGDVRTLRENKIKGSELDGALKQIQAKILEQFPQEWLIELELLELLKSRSTNHDLKVQAEEHLSKLAKQDEKTSSLIQDGLNLSGAL